MTTQRPVGALALVLVALTAVTACSSGASETGAAGDTAPSTRAPASAPASASASSSAPAPARPAPPVQVSIPSIGVRSTLMSLGLNKDGTVEVPPPEKGMTAGWYTGAPVPGERGASVIIGHNNTRFGKAVFHDLRKVGKGAEIAVRNAAGETARFTVTRTETVAKKAFPTERVYAQPNTRDLRLITCDGAVDAEGHPLDNLIVYATAQT
ncbi:class F sortase [Streptomyces sp. NPDC001985]|uniref:class F sortase n=1 Tax=Streptomyces sp. NPDC001985 TaxID=3154406 RepID=UPI003331A3C4